MSSPRPQTALTGQRTLSPRQDKALAALLCSATIAEAARTAQVGERSIRRWLGDADFKNAFAAARREVAETALARLQSTMGQAVTALQTVLEDTEASAAARVSAARTTLELAIKVAELAALEERVAALEAVTVTTHVRTAWRR